MVDILARISSIAAQEVPAEDEAEFRITNSQDGEARTLISPDVSICSDCLRELFDPADRRYRYPFINCTNCGPRFTIVSGIPYDRARTSMAMFPMCAECQAEYDDPLSRRFHAEPSTAARDEDRLAFELSNGIAVFHYLESCRPGIARALLFYMQICIWLIWLCRWCHPR